MKEIHRLLEDKVVDSLQAFPAVYIAGPRQSGKTTLAKRIASKRHKADYITFDDIQLRSAVSRDPEAFLRSLNGAVILDEVQMVPEIFRPLKIIIDENRTRDDGGVGKFLLTGSASVMALPKLSDALVGRLALHTLLPLSNAELSPKNKPDFISRAFEGTWNFKQCEERKPIEIMMKASFPELLTLKSSKMIHEWCNGYLNTILQRDVRMLLEIDKVASLPDMLRLLATRAGGVLNEANLSRATELNHVTAKKYRILLENLFLTISIPAWTVNLGKRLVKSPKIYLGDLNFLSYLLNIELEDSIYTNSFIRGQMFENFVAIELSKQLTFSDIRAKLYHYRATSGQEIDFILEGSAGKIVAIEVKSATKASKEDFRHIETLSKELGDKFHMGFVVYQGNDIVPFGENLFAVPVSVL